MDIKIFEKYLTDTINDKNGHWSDVFVDADKYNYLITKIADYYNVDSDEVINDKNFRSWQDSYYDNM